MKSLGSNPVHGCITIFKLKVQKLIEELRLIPGTEEQVKVLESWLKG